MARKYKENRASWVKRGATPEERKVARYEAYLRTRQSQARKLLEKGLYMNKTKPYTFEEWEVKDTQYRNELKKEKEKGDRKSIGNVAQYIVRNEAYKVSYKQEKSLRNWVKDMFPDELEEQGLARFDKEGNFIGFTKDFTMKLQQGELFEELGVGDYISDLYHELKQGYINDGMTTHDAVMSAKQDISSTIFGSP